MKIRKLTSREKILVAIVIILVAALVTLLTTNGGLSDLFRENVSPENAAKIYTSFYSASGNVVLPTEFNTQALLEVHFIDVGQGDAIFIRFPDGKDMLIDCGSGATASQEARDEFSDYLLDLEVGTLDYFIVTHPDSDHVNLSSIVLNYFEVENIYYNDLYDGQTDIYRSFVDMSGEEGASLFEIDSDGEHYIIENTEENYRMDVYAPGNARFSDDNSMSVMCLLQYGGRKILFTGDACYDTEEYFLEHFQDGLDIDIIKVGHHGSETSSSQGFLDYITPEYAVISVGDSYGHPSSEVMNRLFDSGTVTYRTNRHGNIVLYVDDSGDFGFLPEKNAPIENNSLLLPEKKLLPKVA
ncbi:MAG: MBL fold metallo-hydrolase [Clostridia bacterium]|nr:MBL fold metallo-hydrolase [Clostridia bacterium]